MYLSFHGILVKRMKGTVNRLPLVWCFYHHCIVTYAIYRLFFGYADWQGNSYEMNISSIRIQETSSNLEKLVKPITTLDMIVSENVNWDNEIDDNSGHASLISTLFKRHLNPTLFENVVCNPYILKSFRCFINTKQEIRVSLRDLGRYCRNKALLGLVFSKLVKNKEVKEKDQNLLNKEVLKVFAHVNYLYISCWKYSFCLLSFLSVIDGTKVNKVDIDGIYWLPIIACSSSFDFICSQYQKANYKLEFKDRDNEWLIISRNAE